MVTEKVPWTGSLAGINSLGFGGTNAHIVLQHNRKNKVNNSEHNMRNAAYKRRREQERV